MNGRRWLRGAGYTAVVLGGAVGGVVILCLFLGLLLATLLGGLFVPFAGLWFLSSVSAALPIVLADGALILAGATMVAASRP